MLSAAECIAKAKDVADRAALIEDAPLRAGLFHIAEKWLDLSAMAEHQDAGELSEMVRRIAFGDANRQKP